MRVELSLVSKDGNVFHQYDDCLENVPVNDVLSIKGGLSGFIRDYVDGIKSMIHNNYERDENEISAYEFERMNFESKIVARATFTGGFVYEESREFYWQMSMDVTIKDQEFNMDPLEVLSGDPPTMLVRISSPKSKRNEEIVVSLNEESHAWKEVTTDYLRNKIKSVYPVTAPVCV